MAALRTVREEARDPECPFREYRLRMLIAQGRVPGVRIGNRFLIDHAALVEQVRAESLANAGGAET